MLRVIKDPAQEQADSSPPALSPIPSPPSYWWRRYGGRALHVLAFLLLAGLVVTIWRQMARPAGFVGQVETIQAAVVTPDSGELTNLWASPYQAVRKGDIVAEVMTTDPRTVNSRLAVMRGRMQLIEMEVDPILIRQRAALEYERLVVECARIRADVGTLRVNLERAKNDFKRQEELFRAGLLSEDLFDLAQKTMEALQTEFNEKSKIVEQTEKSLERLGYLADAFVPGGESDPLKRALNVEEQKFHVLQDKLKPLQLLAPVDGVVTAVHRQAGEHVIFGEPVLTITAHKAERILGYLPSSCPFKPTLGMAVRVRTRGFKRASALARVIGVGPHLESVTNALVAPIWVRPVVTAPLTRTIAISLPPELNLLPGEPVDLELLPQLQAPPPPSQETKAHPNPTTGPRPLIPPLATPASGPAPAGR